MSIYSTENISNTMGTVIGYESDKALTLGIDKIHRYGNILVVGEAGTGKTSCFTLGYVLQLIKRGESAIIQDTNGELYKETASLFESKGYRVRVFNLTDPTRSDSFNCMSTGNFFFENSLFHLCGEILGHTKKTDLYDTDREMFTAFGFDVKALLEGLLLYVGQRDNIPDRDKTLGKVYDIIANDKDLFKNIYLNAKDSGHTSAPHLLTFTTLSKERKLKAKERVLELVSEFADDVIQNITSENDLDFSLCGKEKCAYFIVGTLPDSLVTSLIWNTAYWRILKEEDSRKRKFLDVAVNFIIDDLGSLPELIRLHFPVNRMWVRPNMRTVCCVQSFEEMICPASVFDINIFFGGTGNPDTCDEFALLCEKASEGQSESAKYTAEKLRYLDANKIVCVSANGELKVTNKCHYSKYPVYITIGKKSIGDYEPFRLR